MIGLPLGYKLSDSVAGKDKSITITRNIVKKFGEAPPDWFVDEMIAEGLWSDWYVPTSLVKIWSSAGPVRLIAGRYVVPRGGNIWFDLTERKFVFSKYKGAGSQFYFPLGGNYVGGYTSYTLDSNLTVEIWDVMEQRKVFSKTFNTALSYIDYCDMIYDPTENAAYFCDNSYLTYITKVDVISGTELWSIYQDGRPRVPFQPNDGLYSIGNYFKKFNKTDGSLIYTISGNGYDFHGFAVGVTAVYANYQGALNKYNKTDGTLAGTLLSSAGSVRFFDSARRLWLYEDGVLKLFDVNSNSYVATVDIAGTVLETGNNFVIVNDAGVYLLNKDTLAVEETYMWRQELFNPYTGGMFYVVGTDITYKAANTVNVVGTLVGIGENYFATYDYSTKTVSIYDYSGVEKLSLVIANNGFYGILLDTDKWYVLIRDTDWYWYVKCYDYSGNGLFATQIANPKERFIRNGKLIVNAGSTVYLIDPLTGTVTGTFANMKFVLVGDEIYAVENTDTGGKVYFVDNSWNLSYLMDAPTINLGVGAQGIAGEGKYLVYHRPGNFSYDSWVVVDLNKRTYEIKQMPGIVIPGTRVSNSIFTNYYTTAFKDVV